MKREFEARLGARVGLANGTDLSSLARVTGSTTQTADASALAADGAQSGSDRLIAELAAALDERAAAVTRISELTGNRVAPYTEPSPEERAQLLYASIDEEDYDEPPVPIPSAWLSRPDLVQSSFVRQQVRAILLGFSVGLLVILPVVAALTGQLAFLGIPGLGLPPTEGPAALVAQGPGAPSWGAQNSNSQNSSAQNSGAIIPPMPQPLLRKSVSLADSTPAPQAPPVAEVVPQKPVEMVAVTIATPPINADAPLILAERAVLQGDLVRARELLIGARSQGSKEAVFALAETYDPNMLAAWGVRGAKADVGQARTLYQEALAGGIMRAKQRLDALE